jgi:hypothetical protein
MGVLTAYGKNLLTEAVFCGLFFTFTTTHEEEEEEIIIINMQTRVERCTSNRSRP